MILLKATTETLELTTSSTADIDYSISYVDITTTTFSPSTSEGKITTATTTTILSAPSASTQRQIKLMSIRNTHASTANTVSVKKDISGTDYVITANVALAAGEVFEYVDGDGWIYYAADGTVKGSGGGGGGNTGYISAGGNTASLGTVVFSNSNGVSFGLNGQTVTASVGGLTNINVSAGTTSNNLSALTFNNGNGVSFGINGSTVTASVATSLTNINVSAGTTSNNLSAVTFSNSNGMSFGLNGSTITGSYTVPTVTNSSLTMQAGGSTLSSVSRVAFIDSNGISFGASTSNNGSITITASHNGITSQSNQQVTLYATGNTTQNSSTVLNASSLLFRGTGNASLGFSNGSIIVSDTGAAGGGITNINISAGTTSNNLSAFTVSNSNGVSFGLDGSTLTASIATSLTNINFSGGTTSNNLSNIVFSNSNGVSFGLNGSTVTASVNAGGGGFTYSGFNPYADQVKVAGQVGNATINIDPVRFDNVVFDRLINNINFTATSNSSGSMTVSFWNGLYTRNASTLSLLSSFSTSTNVSMSGTVGSYSLFSGIRDLSIPASMTITAGDYWLAVVSRTTTGGAAGMTMSQQLASNVNSVYAGRFGVAHNTTMQLTLGQGIYSVTSAGLPNSIGFNQIRGSDSGARRPPFIMFANSTV